METVGWIFILKKKKRVEVCRFSFLFEAFVGFPTQSDHAGSGADRIAHESTGWPVECKLLPDPARASEAVWPLTLVVAPGSALCTQQVPDQQLELAQELVQDAPLCRQCHRGLCSLDPRRRPLAGRREGQRDPRGGPSRGENRLREGSEAPRGGPSRRSPRSPRARPPPHHLQPPRGFRSLPHRADGPLRALRGRPSILLVVPASDQ